jgi:hypothetical protein
MTTDNPARSRHRTPHVGESDIGLVSGERYGRIIRALHDADPDAFMGRLAGASRRSPPRRCHPPSAR